jgi:hypothetical protein
MNWKDIAKITKLSPATISNIKHDTCETKFFNLLSVAKCVFENEYILRFKKWCVQFKKPQNVCYALDYLAINRQFNELDELIKTIKSENCDKDLLEWVRGYEILSLYYKDEDPEEVLNQIREYNPSTTEMQILSVITEFWCRNRLRDYSIMSSLISGLNISISKISDTHLRDSFTMQLKNCLAFVNLYKKNNIELARKYAEEIISSNFSATFTANASYLLGMSYLFDNYDLCLGNILRYRELLKESGRMSEIKIVNENDIPFINNIWNKHSEYPKTNDISELAHYEALNGDKDLALKLVNRSIQENGKSGFKLYYKALATGDKSLFMESLIFFINKKGDKFYAILPFQHLKDDPMFGSMAKLLFND